jgi:hypothetical protein
MVWVFLLIVTIIFIESVVNFFRAASFKAEEKRNAGDIYSDCNYNTGKNSVILWLGSPKTFLFNGTLKKLLTREETFVRNLAYSFVTLFKFTELILRLIFDGIWRIIYQFLYIFKRYIFSVTKKVTVNINMGYTESIISMAAYCSYSLILTLEDDDEGKIQLLYEKLQDFTNRLNNYQKKFVKHCKRVDLILKIPKENTKVQNIVNYIKSNYKKINIL